MQGKVKVLGLMLAMLFASPVAYAQGNFASGQMIWNDENNGCENCHDDGQGNGGVVAVRNQIRQRPLPVAGLTYQKSLNALNMALAGMDPDGNPTGMDGLFPAPFFSAAQLADLAQYISNMPNPAPLVSYLPAIGPVFPATAVGASSTQVLTVSNTGTAPLIFANNGAASIATGPFSSDFTVNPSQAPTFCQGKTLEPNVGSCTVSVLFSPQAGSATARNAQLTLTTTAPSTPTSVSMFGNLPVQAATTPPVTTPPPAAGTPPGGTTAPGNSANAPSDGGGGALPWQAAGLLLLALLAGMRRKKGLDTRARLASAMSFAALGLVVITTGADAQINRGRELYLNTAGATGAPMSCSNGGCHGPTVTANLNGVLRGANNAALIQNAVTTNKGGMGFYANFLVAADYSALAAYIGNPAGNVALSVGALAFGNQTVGSTGQSQTVAVVNSTLAAVSVSQIGATPTPEFAATNNCLGTLAAGAQCTIGVTFTPGAAGARTGTLAVTSSASPAALNAALSGSGVLTATPAANWSATTLSFGQRPTGQSQLQPVTLNNNGGAPLVVSAVALVGENASEFRIATTSTCAPGSLAAGASCRLDVEFRPVRAGTKSAAVRVSHNAGSGSSDIAVSGTATGATTASVGGSSALAPSNVGGGGTLAWQWLGMLFAVLILRRGSATRFKPL